MRVTPKISVRSNDAIAAALLLVAAILPWTMGGAIGARLTSILACCLALAGVLAGYARAAGLLPWIWLDRQHVVRVAGLVPLAVLALWRIVIDIIPGGAMGMHAGLVFGVVGALCAAGFPWRGQAGGNAAAVQAAAGTGAAVGAVAGTGVDDPSSNRSAFTQAAMPNRQTAPEPEREPAPDREPVPNRQTVKPAASPDATVVLAADRPRWTPQQALNPDTPLEDLATIAAEAPHLRPQVAANPSTYPDLLDWLRDLHDPDVDAALNTRKA